MLVLLASALQVPGPPVPPAPRPPAIGVMPEVVGQRPPTPAILEYDAGEVRCRGEVVRPISAERPLPASHYTSDVKGLQPFTLAFRIGSDGRPLGISNPNRPPGAVPYLPNDDLAPALAAWRFPAGAERLGCAVSFTPRLIAVAAAPTEELYRFVALPRLGYAGWREAIKRLQEEGGGCFTPRYPKERLRAIPDFDSISQAPGTFSWTFVGFDVTSSGKTSGVRTLASDGNPELDRAGIEAVGRNEYASGDPRTGCHIPYFRRQNVPLEAPPAPERDVFVAKDATCDNAVPFVRKPVMIFPENFRRRSIEGWAVVRYDVAPWGATGNFKVLAAEPAAAFGDAAQRIIAAATRPPSPAGATGCVDRVRFVLPADGTEPNTTDVPPPIAVD
jgi:hypothetical protein